MNDTRKRRIRREIATQFRTTFDLNQLDYPKLLKPVTGKSKIYGALVAGIAYGAAYYIAYLLWLRGALPDDKFSMWSWMFMIPCTFVGITVWKLFSNRHEYPVRQHFKAHIQQLEKNNGLIWRYEPALIEKDLHNKVTKLTIKLSRGGETDKLMPEDYSDTIKVLYFAFSDEQDRKISQATAEQIEKNLNS